MRWQSEFPMLRHEEADHESPALVFANHCWSCRYSGRRVWVVASVSIIHRPVLRSWLGVGMGRILMGSYGGLSGRSYCSPYWSGQCRTGARMLSPEPFLPWLDTRCMARVWGRCSTRWRPAKTPGGLPDDRPPRNGWSEGDSRRLQPLLPCGLWW